MCCTRLANGGLFPTGDPIVPFVISPQFECLNKRTHTPTPTHTVHMALMGYFIVFSFVTKPGQTLEFLLWGTIVPLNFLAGYYCSIVASTPQPTVYASTMSCFTYTVWTFFCSRVLKKVKFFKPLPFPLKIVLGADFVSVFPLNILFHFETDNTKPKRLPGTY